MKCKQSEELWSDFLENSLSPPLRKDLEEHLDSCAHCASLLETFREIVETLGTLSHPQPNKDLVKNILAAGRPQGADGSSHSIGFGFPGLPLPAWGNWAALVSAAAVIVFLVLGPFAPFSNLGTRLSRYGHQAYSFGLHVAGETEQLMDELNVLRMTMGVAFEDRVDRLNERLKDLEEVRRKNELPTDKSSNLTTPLQFTDLKDTEIEISETRSLL